MTAAIIREIVWLVPRRGLLPLTVIALIACVVLVAGAALAPYVMISPSEPSRREAAARFVDDAARLAADSTADLGGLDETDPWGTAYALACAPIAEPSR